MLSKRLINSNDAAAGGSCTTNTNDYPTTNVAYYKMSTAADEKDTYNGAATDVNFNVQGKFGNAAEFNGSSSVISLGTSSPLNTFGGAQTISIWVKPSSASQEAIIGYRNDSTFYWNLIEIMSDNTIRFLLRGSSGSTLVFNSAGTITLNQWNHIAVTVDSTSAKIYINNGSAETASNSITSFSNSEPTSIGGDGTTDTDFFTGQIDQVRIFSSALNATQVASLYNEVYCVPTIVPTSYFNSVLYTGNSSTQAITSVGFQPDFTWIKRRDGTENHYLQDSVRGSTQQIYTNLTNSQFNETTAVTSFSANGFNMGSYNGINNSSETYVAWNWKAGGAAVSNTYGTITSQVSANVDAGFSISTFTSDASTLTAGHGLNSTPDLVIVKTTSFTDSWFVNSSALTNQTDRALRLNETSAEETNNTFWNNTAPTSTTFSLGSGISVSGQSYVAYCFHSVDGFSKIGSYVGGGATDVPVNLGFRPAFVMIKSTTTGRNWMMYDNKRETGTVPYENDTVLFAESSSLEVTGNTLRGIQFTSSGFVLNQNYANTNGSGETHIYMAFAEEALPYVTRNATNPFGDSSELALYKFEDNANDAEGNYNGTASNVTYASGYIDKAAVFNGSSSLISLPTGVDRNNNFTLSFWVNFDTLSDYDSLITLQINYRVYVNAMANGSLDFKGGANTLSTNAGVVATGNWYNIVCTKSSTLVGGKAAIIYVNGVEVASNNDVDNAPAANDTGLNLLGAYNANAAGGNFFYLDGKLDQVRIFNRVLDSGEVTALYNE